MVRIKRAYDEPARSDGYRVLETHRAATGTVTLVYGARDEEHNGAAVLRDAIAGALASHAT